jgi:methionine synthase II (cobalamin-independent)
METEEIMLGSINVEIKRVENDKDVVNLHVQLRKE